MPDHTASWDAATRRRPRPPVPAGDLTVAKAKLVLELYSAKDALLSAPTLMEITVVDGFQCPDCEAFFAEAGEGPLYECGSCGTTFTRDTSADGDSNRCPDCNRFGSKIGESVCPECEEGEPEPVTYLECPFCEMGVLIDEYAMHLEGNCR